MEENKDFEVLVKFLGGVVTGVVTAFTVKQLKDNPDVLKAIYSTFNLNKLIDK